MKNLKLLAALLILACASQVVAEDASFVTWSGEKQEPVPQRKLASYDTIEKKCSNLAATIRARAKLVVANDKKYACEGGIDGLVNAFGEVNHARIAELEREPLFDHYSP